MNILKSWKDESNRRWYLSDQDNYPYPSATTIVSIAKSYRYKDMPRDDKSNKRLQQAADKGTDIHSVLEDYNRSIQALNNGIVPTSCTSEQSKLNSRYQQIVDNYSNLMYLIGMNEGEVQIIEVERQCIHPIYKYAGRFDILVTVGGEYEIWDYKTSKSIHEEDGWQLVAYMEALKLEGIPVKRVRILHIDKITSKITDLKYQHHEYMFNKFLSCMELFKGIYFNDLLKGRINDIEELGKKYKWPLEELTKNYVLCYNLNKGDNNMELTEVTGLGDGQVFKKDPTRVDFTEPVIGVVLGNVPSRWVHKVGSGKTTKAFVCEGKDKCERCKLGMKKTVQFKANFLTVDDADKAVIKRIESESTRLFFALSDAFKTIKEAGGDLKTAVLRIERTGKSFDTQYKVENIAPKHKALKDVAETVKPLTPFTLKFDDVDTESNTKQVDRTDIVEK